MCVVCVMQDHPKRIGTASSASLAVKDYFRNVASIAVSLPSLEARQFMVEQLRSAADQIEMVDRVGRQIDEQLRQPFAEVMAKSLKVEAHLIKREGDFYNQYRVPMPDTVREAVKRELWDALETEVKLVRDDRGTDADASGHDFVSNPADRSQGA